MYKTMKTLRSQGYDGLKGNAIKMAVLMLVLFVILTTLSACGKNSSASRKEDPFKGRSASDVSAYESMKDYEGDIMFSDTTVKEIKDLMDDKETFVLFLGFADCAYCDKLIQHLNAAAESAGRRVGYIDTRKKPEWKNNMEIDDYDVFVDMFGKYLRKEEDGKEHLYTPDVYFVKDGEVAARHDGVVEGANDPEKDLTDSQIDALTEILRKEFASLE